MFENISADVKDTVQTASLDLSQKNSLEKHLTTIQSLFTLLTIFILPLIFLPLTLDWFDEVKILFLAASVVIIGLVSLIRVLSSANSALVTSEIDKILLFILVSLAISSWLAPNKIASFLTEPAVWVILVAFFYLLVNSIETLTTWVTAFNLLTWAVGLLGILHFLQVILSLSGRFIPQWQSLLSQMPLITSLTPAGTPYTLGLLLVLTTPLIISKYLAETGANKSAKRETVVLLILLVLGLLAVAFTLYNNRPIFMDPDTGRRIATGALGKSYSSALFGIGPGEYVSAFTQFKPAEFNSSPFWGFNFTTANSFALYLLTVGGLALAFSFILLVIRLYRLARKRITAGTSFYTEKGVFASLALGVIAMVLIPIPFLALWFTFCLLGLLFSWYKLQQESGLVKTLEIGKKLQIGFLAVGLALTLATVYGLGISFAADYLYRNSLETARRNKGVETYNLQVQAARLAPWKDNFRIALSQTNLALADALASQGNLTDQQKQTIVQLVQQAIIEARNAVALSRNSASNWQNLALVYRNLINFAQGADQWAIVTQNQAIALDPTNPRLRLDIGGIFFAKNDYSAAVNHFSAAVALKPDFANSHYNLAQAFKSLSQNDKALSELSLTSQLVCVNSQNKADCDKVKAEIDSLNKTQLATPSSQVAGSATSSPSVQPETLASPSAQNPNLPRARTQPPVKISSPSGELAQ